MRPVYILETQREHFIKDIRHEFMLHGIHPVCRNCVFDCTQYNAPGLSMLECLKGIWEKRGKRWQKRR